MSQNDSAERERHDRIDGNMAQPPGKGAAQRFGMFRVGQHQSALHVSVAVAAGGKQEMSVADGADAFEELVNFRRLHDLSGLTLRAG
jgi:hypothetical protein